MWLSLFFLGCSTSGKSTLVLSNDSAIEEDTAATNEPELQPEPTSEPETTEPNEPVLITHSQWGDHHRERAMAGAADPDIAGVAGGEVHPGL